MRNVKLLCFSFLLFATNAYAFGVDVCFNDPTIVVH
jgi:hypothetical protein